MTGCPENDADCMCVVPDDLKERQDQCAEGFTCICNKGQLGKSI